VILILDHTGSATVLHEQIRHTCDKAATGASVSAVPE
jgi:hypothetical protein